MRRLSWSLAFLVADALTFIVLFGTGGVRAMRGTTLLMDDLRDFFLPCSISVGNILDATARRRSLFD